MHNAEMCVYQTSSLEDVLDLDTGALGRLDAHPGELAG